MSFSDRNAYRHLQHTVQDVDQQHQHRHLVAKDNASSAASLRHFLAIAHDRYAGHPHSTSKEELWKLLARLDECTMLKVQQGFLNCGNTAHNTILEAWLLGGCIAYSLGDMNRAIEWNLRILRIDPCYVEAMSNLAAGLRALHRDAEAEAWWIHAVQIRPTYWDAADHLFSFLCAQNRYADAANVLSYVERRTTPTSGSNADLARYLAIINAKGTLLYALEDHLAAAHAFERVLALVTNVRSLTSKENEANIMDKGTLQVLIRISRIALSSRNDGRMLLTPQEARFCLLHVFDGELPALRMVTNIKHRHAITQTTANALLTIAKILQDGMACSSSRVQNSVQSTEHAAKGSKTASTATLVELVGHMPSAYDILPLYYLSLALHASPSTANNIGILLASLAHSAVPSPTEHILALNYYRYGLSLDSRHPHLYTNLGSLLKDQGNLQDAISMYKLAVECDPNFDIALANLANAVKDQGKVSIAIEYYRRAVAANPKFDEAVCGLAISLSSVCSWKGRGCSDIESRGVNSKGLVCFDHSMGWISRILEIVNSHIRHAHIWGTGVTAATESILLNEIISACGYSGIDDLNLNPWIHEIDRIKASEHDEGAKIIELLDAAGKRARWRWYYDKYVSVRSTDNYNYHRPHLPDMLSLPAAPTILPFHTFCLPLNPVQVREICRRTALRVTVTAQRYSWLPDHVFEPPAPPNPSLRIGYLSSDFNNHPLSHLMQSVFGFHRQSEDTKYPVFGICYATTPSDGSKYRHKIEKEAHLFVDCSGWSTQDVVKQMVQDGVHILVNLNGFTRGARNEIIACRPAPINVAFMGFAGSMGAEWSDYILADKTAIADSAVRKYKPEDENKSRILRYHNCTNPNDWVYFEDIVYCKHSFFCCDHRQSAPDNCFNDGKVADVETRWQVELEGREKMRRQIFPNLPRETVVLANFNQLYKIDPSTFMTWISILERVPNSVLWLLKFPDLGAENLLNFADQWAGKDISKRILFTDVAGKDMHLLRSRVPDLFLDTPECNAHTTATDVVWAGTPLLTWSKHEHKMCSRIAASILKSAINEKMANWLIVNSEQEYEDRAVELSLNRDELLKIRYNLYIGREKAPIFDTVRWTRDLEQGYWMMWQRWVEKGGEVVLEKGSERNLYI
ncbi:glycosyl transferase family 41-domain-containing protein [Lipomyces japonicus]|uniref:glycosyl transferase family 41-domain-containing protein n=1 Tax=Lipomyces japonicus TaxID=56871 RepID=UPI0034CE738C